MANFLNKHSLKLFTGTLTLLLIAGFTDSAFAQEETGPAPESLTTSTGAPGEANPGTAAADKSKKKKTKNVKLDFSDEMVEGNSDKPYEMMLMKRPDQKFKKILKFREDFHNNMESSFDDVR